MNNPIIVTDRVLSYYDSKLKGYVGSFYGCDMIVEWEPMENGKNYFKLKIALKNKHGDELFSKIIDFPLEQTIVSGEYNNKDKSLILYFQDGSYTSIPIEDLIEGLASKLDLEKKADLGEKQIVSGNAYSVEVPTSSAPYAKISKIGGMTYKVDNTLRDAKVTEVKSVGTNLVPFPYYDFTDNTFEVNGVTGTVNPDTQVIRLVGVATSTFERRLNIMDLSAGTYTIYAEQSWDYTRVYLRKNGELYRSIAKGNEPYNFTVNSGEIWSVYILVLGGYSYNDTIAVMVNRGTEALHFAPYTEHTLAIPESVQSLKGYGQSNPDNAEEYNYIDLKNQKFISFGYISNSVWVSRYSTTDIDIPSIIGVEGGGTLTFENEYGYDVPYEIEYTINSNDVIGAEEFVGNLKGTAEVAKYYDDNGNPSAQTIGEALNKLLDAGNPLKITTESIGQLSASQVITGISANILANPPVAINDIILDRYLDGDAAYLCFWVVTGVQGGSTDSTMTLQGAGNIYVGGGNSSIADRAIADGNGRNIIDTYETKTNATSTKNELQTNIDTVDAARRLNTTNIANIKNGTTPVGKANNATFATPSTEDDSIDMRITKVQSLVDIAVNTANLAYNKASKGIQRAYTRYTSGAGGAGTFHLYLQLQDSTTIEVEDFSSNMEGFIMDVLMQNQ